MHEIHLGVAGMFAVTWATFLAAAVISFGVQLYRAKGSMSPLAFVRFAFPASGWLTKSARTDLFTYVLSKFLTIIRFVTLVFAADLLSKFLQAHFPITHHANVNIGEIVFWSILLFIVIDFSNYLTHFLQHFVPILWELHKVHHSATFLNPLTTKRMHPLGDLFDDLGAALLTIVPIGLCQYWTGLKTAEIAVLIVNANMIGTIIVLDSLRHSHFPISFGPFDRVFLSPHMHQLHHSCAVEHWDKTFGNKLSIWDWAFGTMYRPSAGEEIPLGLGKPEDADYHSLWGVYVGPLVKIGRLLAGKPVYTYAGQAPETPKPFFERVFWRKPPHVYLGRSSVRAVAAPSRGAVRVEGAEPRAASS